MPRAANPWDVPEWHAIRREATLARQLIGTGATALGRATYADGLGEYYTAFFGLSVGIERLAKLVLVADYAGENDGSMPDQAVMKEFGHDLVRLLDKAAGVVRERRLELRYSRPTSAICSKIVGCLDAFADARRGRYANFAALGNPSLTTTEPIALWWSEVADAILAEHYFGKAVQRRVEGRARQLDDIVAPYSLVNHFNESGDRMKEVLPASIRTGQASVVQRYGRYYALLIVRWLASVYIESAQAAWSKHGLDAFYGSWEFLETYTVNDHFLRSRKVWPLR